MGRVGSYNTTLKFCRRGHYSGGKNEFRIDGTGTSENGAIQK